MRIIAGQFGGRRLEVPKGRDIRPTSDKVRGSIFNALGSRVALDGVRVLDLCSGTGAMGIEAFSRGAASCIFIDKSRESLDLTRRNVQIMDDFLEAHFIQADITALKALDKGLGRVDVFFCDPPYKMGLIPPCLVALRSGNWLAAGAVGVLEGEKSWDGALPAGYHVLSEKIYGDTKVLLVEYAP